MKKLLLLAVGLLGLGAFALPSAKAGPEYYYNRGNDCDYRRPAYHERYDDGCDYRPRQRVIVREYYERPSYGGDDCRPRRYHHRRHVNFFLPLPPPPF